MPKTQRVLKMKLQGQARQIQQAHWPLLVEDAHLGVLAEDLADLDLGNRLAELMEDQEVVCQIQTKLA